METLIIYYKILFQPLKLQIFLKLFYRQLLKTQVFILQFFPSTVKVRHFFGLLLLLTHVHKQMNIKKRVTQQLREDLKIIISEVKKKNSV